MIPVMYKILINWVWKTASGKTVKGTWTSNRTAETEEEAILTVAELILKERQFQERVGSPMKKTFIYYEA
jgi:hypothetical protein